MMVACRPPENSDSERSASSTGSVRQPASATAKKLSKRALGLVARLGGNVLPLRVDDEAGEGFGGSGSGLHRR